MSILLGETWDFDGSGFDECANWQLYYITAQQKSWLSMHSKEGLNYWGWIFVWAPFALGDDN